MFGTLTAGFLLDDQRAEQLKRATGSDIAFAMDGRIVAADAAADVRGRLAAARSAPGVSYMRARLGGLRRHRRCPCVSRTGPRTRGRHRCSCSGPYTSQLRGLRTINVALLTTAVLAIVLATILSYAVARSMTRPLGTITATMREVAATGDLTTKIDLPGAQLVAGRGCAARGGDVQHLTESVARVQRETAQRDRLLGARPSVDRRRARSAESPDDHQGCPAFDAPGRAENPSSAKRWATSTRGRAAQPHRPRRPRLRTAPAFRFRHSGSRALVQRGGDCRAGQRARGSLHHHSIPDPLDIVTDAERLRAALINILANARQAVTPAAPRRTRKRASPRRSMTWS